MTLGIDAAAILAAGQPNLRTAITTHVREAIRRGDLAPGQNMPSTRELAALLDTSAPNVHHALTPLVKEGLITRDRKQGTTVRLRPRELTCAATYLHHWKLDIISPFQHALVGQLGEELARRGIEHRVVVDNFTRYGLEQITEWAATDEIQGVVMPFAGADVESIMQVGKLPVPAVFMGHNQRPTPVGARQSQFVHTDWRALARRVVGALEDQGCRRAGIISSLARHGADDGAEHPFYGFLRTATAEHGIELRDEWLQAVASEDDYLPTPEAKTRFAYDRCNRLLDLPGSAGPDGLFIFCDGLIPGALLAIYRRGRRVPEDLKLVVYRNWEIGVPGLPPCAMVGLSVTAVARAFVDSIVNQYHGRQKPPSGIAYETRYNPGD